MKYQLYFVLTCLVLQQMIFSDCCEEESDECGDGFLDWSKLDSDVLSGYVEESLAGGFSYAKSYRDTALVSRRTCSFVDCTIFESIHSFKIASFKSNSLSLCQGLGMLQASVLLKRRLGLSSKNVQTEIAKIPISEVICESFISKCGTGFYDTPEACDMDTITLQDGSVIPRCAVDRYRSIDGFCNNPIDLRLGSSFRPFNRLLPPAYDDGLTAPRGFINKKLPLARAISRSLSNIAASTVPPVVTQMVKAWGQFLDHDITRTPETSAGMGKDRETLKLECCEEGELRSESSCEREHVEYDEPDVPECLPILIPEGDDFFESVGVECLEFIRSAPADQGCTFAPREQINEVTSFIDASNVYGSTVEEANRVRLFVGGLLLTSIDMPGNMTNEIESCDSDELLFLPATNSTIANQYIAGDTRSNEQPSLTSLHTIWMRIHNKIADYISERSQFLDDESIFQDARRIVIALMQHITYSDFVPKVIGNVAVQWYHLRPLPFNSYNRDYDPFIDPRIVNVFGHAAFRFGHTLVTDNMAGETDFLMGDNFFQSSVLFQTDTTQPSEILKSEATMPAEPTDALLDEVLTQRLFFRARLNQNLITHGSDLMSLNIQRGRDHGLPSYLEWRRYCGFKDVDSFDEMESIMEPQVAVAFAHLYDSVEDVDLFPAAMAENVLAGEGILGPTFSCILGEQFNRLKYGDRYFFENGPFVHRSNPEIPFTISQLRTIKTTSFAELLCDVTCSDMYPIDVFRYETSQPMFTCTDGEDAPIFAALKDGSYFN